MFRVVLVDDHQLLLDALQMRLQCEPDFEVVGTAADNDTGLRLILDHKPAVAVLDVEVPGRGSFEVAALVTERLPETRVVFLSGYVSDIFLEQALQAGASGYLVKGEPSAVLLEHLRRIACGEMRFSASAQSRLDYDSRARRWRARSSECLANLSQRQVEVLRHLVRGDSVKDVAKALHQSERAVESQKYRIMQHLGIHDRVELTRFAIREGLTLP